MNGGDTSVFLAATCVCGSGDSGTRDPVAAVRVHGLYPSVTAARTAVHALAAEEPDQFTYIIDDVGRWLPACEPHPEARVVVDEVEEVSCAENTDPSQGRTGSVCDVRRHSGPALDRGKPHTSRQPASLIGGTPSADHGASSSTEDPVRQREAKRQQRQLDDLLRGPLPSEPLTEPTQYAMARGHLATLRAFERKLGRLALEADARCTANREHLRQLDGQHPEFRTSYLENYTRALGEVGLDPEQVPLMQYLREDEDDRASSQD